jgi:hypothetical protein
MVPSPVTLSVRLPRELSFRAAARNPSKSLSENTIPVLFRHSRMLLAGIQTRAMPELLCGWIPAKSMRE